MVRFINVGVGVNVNNDPTVGEPMAISLRKILGRNIPRKALLSEFLNRFERRLNNGALENVVSEWKEYAETLNRYVRIVTHREISEGLAIDVDKNGALILELADGSLKKIIHGDCFHENKR
jgi:BirA family biotin operon repressor/biotin-[acetyl-CoA-carboxylase] ligase